jgi:hypothetical protein
MRGVPQDAVPDAQPVSILAMELASLGCLPDNDGVHSTHHGGGVAYGMQETLNRELVWERDGRSAESRFVDHTANFIVDALCIVYSIVMW